MTLHLKGNNEWLPDLHDGQLSQSDHLYLELGRLTRKKEWLNIHMRKLQWDIQWSRDREIKYVDTDRFNTWSTTWTFTRYTDGSSSSEINVYFQGRIACTHTWYNGTNYPTPYNINQTQAQIDVLKLQISCLEQHISRIKTCKIVSDSKWVAWNIITLWLKSIWNTAIIKSLELPQRFLFGREKFHGMVTVPQPQSWLNEVYKWTLSNGDHETEQKYQSFDLFEYQGKIFAIGHSYISWYGAVSDLIDPVDMWVIQSFSSNDVVALSIQDGKLLGSQKDDNGKYQQSFVSPISWT